jgi:hypothetical protein
MDSFFFSLFLFFYIIYATNLHDDLPYSISCVSGTAIFVISFGLLFSGALQAFSIFGPQNVSQRSILLCLFFVVLLRRQFGLVRLANGTNVGISLLACCVYVGATLRAKADVL